MPEPHDRLARKSDFMVVVGRKSRSVQRLRFGVAMLGLLVLGLAAVPASQASTGGASPIAAAPTAEAETGSTGSELAFGEFRLAGASWYGPGLWGRHTACGQTLRPTTVGVANKTLPCGTVVKFVFHGRTVDAPVIDRGPYVTGRSFDLTAAAAEALAFEGVGVGTVHYALPVEYAAKGLPR